MAFGVIFKRPLQGDLSKLEGIKFGIEPHEIRGLAVTAEDKQVLYKLADYTELMYDRGWVSRMVGNNIKFLCPLTETIECIRSYIPYQITLAPGGWEGVFDVIEVSDEEINDLVPMGPPAIDPIEVQRMEDMINNDRWPGEENEDDDEDDYEDENDDGEDENDYRPATPLSWDEVGHWAEPNAYDEGDDDHEEFEVEDFFEEGAEEHYVAAESAPFWTTGYFSSLREAFEDVYRRTQERYERELLDLMNRSLVNYDYNQQVRVTIEPT